MVGGTRVLVGGLTLFLVFLCFSPSVALAQNWFDDYDAALEQGRSTGRPVLAVFSGVPWCDASREFEATVLTSSKFSQYVVGRCIALHLVVPSEGEASEDHPSIKAALKHGVESVPCAKLFAPDGADLGWVMQDGTARTDVAQFMANLHKLADPVLASNPVPAKKAETQSAQPTPISFTRHSPTDPPLSATSATPASAAAPSVKPALTAAEKANHATPKTSAPPKPHWFTNASKASETARARGAPIVTYYYSRQSSECAVFDTEVLNSPEFAGAAQNLVLLKVPVIMPLNGVGGDNPGRDAMRLGVRCLPSLRFSLPNGTDFGTIFEGSGGTPGAVANSLQIVASKVKDPPDRASDTSTRGSDGSLTLDLKAVRKKMKDNPEPRFPEGAKVINLRSDQPATQPAN